ncbi:hypothetical protein OESDEN_23949 [Oesophagostomum dentatum]|uniref:Receptor ligand binding region domain-containing protein n=2 Tax=Oesophagostomum dentatum TaxID=61180 RepID=A0A0B1RXS0_OESDE|nr:hypothetical protein OESDEN_23949 [Oesophagostomum dentatum]
MRHYILKLRYLRKLETARTISKGYCKNCLRIHLVLSSLTWVLSDCIESTDAGSLIEYVEEGADVVLGPACSASAIISGTVAKYYDFPIVVWAGMFSSTLLNNDDYPTVMASTWSSINQARTLTRLFQKYHWNNIAVVYYAARSEMLPRCSLIISDLEVI